MTSEISFLSSGSEEQPFHSTPVKKRHNNDRKIFTSKTSKGNSDEETFEPMENTDTFTKSLSRCSSSSESQVVTSDVPVLSPWEKWLLKKEEQRRNKVLIDITKSQEQSAQDQILEDEKLRKTKLANERYQQWLKTKKEELEKRKAEENGFKIKKEILEKETKDKSDAMMKSRLHEWNEKKAREKEVKLASNMQEREKILKKSREIQEKANKAYENWLKKKKISKRNYYSYGYVGGILVSYYDATSPPQPSFCNPDPWICASEKTSANL